MKLDSDLSIMALQYVCAPYKWGGNGFDGLDCSGLVLKSLHDIGITLPDMTAQDIFNWAKNNKNNISSEPNEDCLLFFGKDNKSITHIAIALNNKYMIEAGGAGKDAINMSLDDLVKRDARVRIKPISNRKDLIESIKITY